MGCLELSSLKRAKRRLLENCFDRKKNRKMESLFTAIRRIIAEKIASKKHLRASQGGLQKGGCF